MQLIALRVTVVKLSVNTIRQYDRIQKQAGRPALRRGHQNCHPAGMTGAGHLTANHGDDDLVQAGLQAVCLND